ncbi:MAG TPA: hypothetical protein PKM65_19175 [Spirochaetota bacterium]|nr:hypothetical protein [Spirochaetota bacterium]HNT11368.1 hypothetical protein [Spirochaetota bacterium]HOS40638.1 hypothetical protein [Spirochaetota bacterium]
MLKRLMVITLCLSIAILFSSQIFSQDQPTISDDKKAEDKAKPADQPKKDEPPKEAAAEKPADKSGVAMEAKMYTDGINWYANSQVQFKLTTRDNLFVDKLEYRIDNGEVKKYDAPFTIPQEGIHFISYSATDRFGNKELEKMYKIIIDATPPTLLVTSNIPVQKVDGKTYISKDFKLSIMATDVLSGVKKIEYSTNGVDYIEYAGPFSIPPKDGGIELKARAIDNVNNMNDKFVLRLTDETGKAIDMTETTIKMMADNTPPTVEIKATPELIKIENKNFAAPQYKYAVTATDTESGIAAIMVRIDGKGDFVPYTKEIMFTTNGEHTIEAKAYDKVNNVSNLVILSVFVDTVPPETILETISK